MSLRSLDKKTLLSDAAAEVDGTPLSVERTKGWTFVIQTTAVGTATINIEALIGGVWFVIHSQDVSAEGSFMIRDDHGHYEKIRGRIAPGNYTDGTHSVYATGSVDSL
jgi:hypothetical protein